MTNVDYYDKLSREQKEDDGSDSGSDSENDNSNDECPDKGEYSDENPENWVAWSSQSTWTSTRIFSKTDTKRAYQR